MNHLAGRLLKHKKLQRALKLPIATNEKQRENLNYDQIFSLR
jgi:hypothetical protein